jgi:hypothetical protein
MNAAFRPGSAEIEQKETKGTKREWPGRESQNENCRGNKTGG